MNTEDVNSSAAKAKEQLEYCCESACDKFYVKQYIRELEHKIKELEDKLNGRN